MKKGFTLIELLAVVVILAIIALIATPLILNMIEDSRERSAIISGENYIRAVNLKIAERELNDYTVEDGDYDIEDNDIGVVLKSGKEITGVYTVEDSGVSYAELCVGKYSVGYNIYGDKIGAFIAAGENYCSGDSYTFVEPDAELLSNVCKNNSLYNESNKFKAYTVEDLVCLSNLVAGGKNFSGKEIYLLKDIDFNNTSSYKNSDTTTYGDINGNGVTEGLKTEVTTGAGFKPIGNSSKKFAGTFLGYGYKISNLMINRTTSYVGLFGYNDGTISGLNLYNVNITGNSYVGGIVGENYRTVKNVIVKGNITGTGTYVGGILGTSGSAYGSGRGVMFSGNVKGSTNVGGLAGQGWYVYGGIYDSTVETTLNSTSSLGYCTSGGISNCKRIRVGLAMRTNRNSGQDGVVATDGENSKFRLNMLDDVVDTYIGGDNDGDGYYFDYDTDNNIVVYSTARKPITNKLKGEGSSDNPYLIRNIKDWRMATATVAKSKHYSITKDLDFGNDLLYAFGTDTNKFNGNINGNMHTLSNINVEGYDYNGVFGYNTGTIRGIKFDGVTIIGKNNNTGIVGYNDGTVSGISAKGVNITGGSYVGGVVGNNNRTVKNIDLKGNITGTGTYVGGILGASGSAYGSGRGVMFSGTVKGNTTVGGLAGQGWYVYGGIYDSKVETTLNSTSSLGYCASSGIADCRRKNVDLVMRTNRNSAQDGVIATTTALKLNMVDGLVDTYIGGDDDTDGYYFDYDTSGDIVVYSTALNPIKNTLSGEGTQASPYLIKNENDWKVATSLVDKSKHFSITSDINFNNNFLYAMGTNENKFNGNINGNMHTLSNINVDGYDYNGVFGYNTGTIRGIKFNSVTIIGRNNNTGIVGYNDGTVTGIVGRNISVSGGTYVGGVVGNNNRTVKNIDLKGNITGTGSYVGGVIGGSGSASGSGRGVVFSGNVTGNTIVGGLAGQGWYVYGGIYDSTIETTLNSTSSLGYCASGGIADCKRKNVNLIMRTNRNSAQDGVIATDNALKLNMVDGLVDTYIGGDDDTDGYYFDYDSNNTITVYSTALNPITNTLSGAGTQASPYLIQNVNDWKVATSLADKSKYFSITSNIDFNNNFLYSMGTNENKFNGNINGNMHTLSNINVDGYDYNGVFGYNTGTIRGIKFNGVTILGKSNNTGIVGYNDGTVNGLAITNATISGTSYVGGAVGSNNRTVKNIEVKGNITGTGSYVGGVIGGSGSAYGSGRGVVFSGNVTGNTTVGGLAGQGWYIYGVVYNSTLKTTLNSTSSLGYCASGGIADCKRLNTNLVMMTNRSGGQDGSAISELTTSNVSSVIDVTDSDSDGYYFGISNGNVVLLSS